MTSFRSYAWQRFRMWIRWWFYNALTLISPTLNTRVRFRRVLGVWPNLREPNDFFEKMQWLKLYAYRRDPLVARCTDKLRVRGYVEECGLGHMLNELYGAYERVDQVPWDALPEKFALKWNFGSGMNILCENRSALDIRQAARRMRRWGRNRYWLKNAEMQYAGIPKRILLERYLETDQGPQPNDYKVYCFGGVPRCVLLVTERDRHARFAMMSPDWTLLGGYHGEPLPEQMDRPECLIVMLEAARILSKPFPFVRVDFYNVGGRPVFGEMTFTPGAALYTAIASIDGRPMGDFICLPQRATRGRAPTP